MHMVLNKSLCKGHADLTWSMFGMQKKSVNMNMLDPVAIHT